MAYLNTETMEYPLHLLQLEEMGWVNGQPLPSKIVNVEPSGFPSLSDQQTFKEVMPVQDEYGIWHQTFEVVDLTSEQILAQRVHNIREKASMGISLTQEEANLLVGSGE
jgi:hypothetical protein